MVVYKVLCKKDNQIYAMKRVNLDFLKERDYNLAVDEASKMLTLKSEFIINLKSFFEKDCCLYIVMDYANGGDL